HEVQGGGVHPDEGRRRAAHAVLQGIPAAVLPENDGRDGGGGGAGGAEGGGVADSRAGRGCVMPGDNVSLVIELITPVAMEKGLRFAIREGGHTVGAGTIAGVVQQLRVWGRVYAPSRRVKDPAPQG